jgi:hypothetical protein
MSTHLNYKNLRFSIILFCVLCSVSCTVRYVPEYNAVLSDEIIRVAKKVDYFYANLQNTSDSLRTFDKSIEHYTEIDVDLNSILMRNKIRPLNSESAKIAENIVSLWTKYKNSHKKNNTYKDAQLVLHRQRMGRMFSAMFDAEEAKKMKPTDLE